MDSNSPQNLALQNAARSGDEETVIRLLSDGADVNCKNEESQTPLHVAAVSSNAVILQLLFDRGADCSVADADGSTALHLALRRGCDSNASLLITLMDDNALSARDIYGLTPLHLAVRLSDSRGIENMAHVQNLVTRGSDVNNRSYSGRRLMQEAARLHDQSIVAALASQVTNLDLRRQPRDQNWGKLRAFMIQTFSDPTKVDLKPHLETYDIVFKLLCTKNFNVEPLYWNIRDCIADQVREVRFAAARVASQELSAFYYRELQKYERATERHDSGFRYLERVWIARVRDEGRTDVHKIKPLHNLLWKEGFVDKEDRLKDLISNTP